MEAFAASFPRGQLHTSAGSAQGTARIAQQSRQTRRAWSGKRSPTASRPLRCCGGALPRWCLHRRGSGLSLGSSRAFQKHHHAAEGGGEVGGSRGAHGGGVHSEIEMPSSAAISCTAVVFPLPLGRTSGAEGGSSTQTRKEGVPVCGCEGPL